MLENAMDETTLKQYLADDPPTIVPLAIKPHFEALNDREKTVSSSYHGPSNPQASILILT